MSKTHDDGDTDTPFDFDAFTDPFPSAAWVAPSAFRAVALGVPDAEESRRRLAKIRIAIRHAERAHGGERSVELARAAGLMDVVIGEFGDLTEARARIETLREGAA